MFRVLRLKVMHQIYVMHDCATEMSLANSDRQAHNAASVRPPQHTHIAGRQGTARRRRCAFAARLPQRVCAFLKRAGASPARADEWEAAVTIQLNRSLYGCASIGIAAVMLAMSVWTSAGAQQQDRETRDQARRQRFTHDGNMLREASATFDVRRISEAPTGFDNLTNGFDLQGPAFDSIDEDTSCRCDRSTTTASSSRRSRPSRTASARPTTRRDAASAIRTW